MIGRYFEIDITSILQGIPTVYKRPEVGCTSPVASSVVKIIYSLMNDTGTLGHVPGPNGLPGGYPPTSVPGLSSGTSGMTLEECIEINEAARNLMESKD